MQGIDISHWQGEIDFQQVKDNGIEFVIIKAGGSDKGFYTDRMFETNYQQAKEVGLNVGAYYFVGKNCTTSESGKTDAERFLEIIKEKQFEMPVCMDIEITADNQRTGATDATISFCETMEHYGYYVSIYTSDSFFRTRLITSKLTAFDKWVARWGTEPTYITNYGIWQYSSTGEIQGINGNVDLNVTEKDYPTIMKKNKINGFYEEWSE